MDSRLDPLTLLSAMAAVTHRATIGTACIIPAYRQPVQAAQAIASLDLLSEGRLIVGVGVGFPGLSNADYALVGVPTINRSARLDDIVALWKQLWSTSGNSSFRGKIMRFGSLPDPLPTRQPGGPPIWLASGNQSAMRRAGERYDGWLPFPASAEAYAAGLSIVGAAARGVGRSRNAVTPALFVTLAVADSVNGGRRALNDYCMAIYRTPLTHVESVQSLIAGPPDHIRAELARFIATGARHIVVRVAALDPGSQREQVQWIAEALLPAATRLSGFPPGDISHL
jgi:alkanesulfonate monooxygenase SsuD/methylene tetrahydromethanopterin reductase-like flavin-dependent oxidoreductase (luciferase family)